MKEGLPLISGAEIMVKCLEKEGVTITFGYPGAAICPFYDMLYQSEIKHILVREEQNAAHMANGYARLQRRSPPFLLPHSFSCPA